VLAGSVVDDEPEGTEADEAPERPHQIADSAEIALQIVRHGLPDHRRQAKRGCIHEIIAVDHAEVYPAASAGGDDVDCAVEVQRYAEGAGEAVRRSEREHREDAVLVDHVIHGAGQRAVAAADYDHRRSLSHGAADGIVERGGVLHRMRGDELYAGYLQLGAGVAEQVLTLARMRIDDEDGFFGDGSGRFHSGTTFREASVSNQLSSRPRPR
jgi:hypothetical protein